MLLLPFKGIFPVRGPNEEMQYNMVIAALLHSDELCQLYISSTVIAPYVQCVPDSFSKVGGTGREPIVPFSSQS